MKKKPPINIQLGKLGITETFVESLRKTFKNREIVRISLLKAFSRDREHVKKTADELCEKLGDIGTFKYTIIGFTIVLKKRRLKQSPNIKFGEQI